MPGYDSSRFKPPAPLALVTVRNIETGQSTSDIPMLIDLGADITLLPGNIIYSAGLTVKTDQEYKLEGFDGTVSVAPTVQAEMVFCGKSFRGPYPLIEQEYGILGRNVLNFLALLFDGPNLNWDEYHRP